MGGAIRLTTTSTAGGTEETAVPLPLKTGSFVLCQALVSQSARVKIPKRKKMRLHTSQTLKPVGLMTKMMTMTIREKEAVPTKRDSSGRLHDDVTFFVTGFYFLHI